MFTKVCITCHNYLWLPAGLPSLRSDYWNKMTLTLINQPQLATADYVNTSWLLHKSMLMEYKFNCSEIAQQKAVLELGGSTLLLHETCKKCSVQQKESSGDREAVLNFPQGLVPCPEQSALLPS